MLNLIPFARARRQMADLNWKPKLFSEFLQFHFPETNATAVASSAISDNLQGDHNSLVYIVPIAGGTPRRVTQKSPSYWHGWSPDGRTLAFVGQRNGEFDIYAIPAAGGEETRLTTAKGLDDGPDGPARFAAGGLRPARPGLRTSRPAYRLGTGRAGGAWR